MYVTDEVPAGLIEDINSLRNFYKIDEGNFSKVYTWNVDCDIVLKIYTDTTSEGTVPDYEVLRHISNTALPRLYAYNDKVCVMSRAPGVDLYRCSETLLKKHINHILSTVAGLFEEFLATGYIMNDIHPGNIMLSSEGVITVIDFNLYIPIDDFARCFRSINAVTGLFDVHGVDILSAAALDVYKQDLLTKLHKEMSEISGS